MISSQGTRALSTHCAGHSLDAFDLSTCALSPGEGFCSHLPSSLPETLTVQMLPLPVHPSCLLFSSYFLSPSFCSTFGFLTVYFNLLITFPISAFICLIFKSSLLSYLHSNPGFSWLQPLLEAFCRSCEHHYPLPELALSPLETAFTFMHLRLSLPSCKFFSLPSPHRAHSFCRTKK